jgi:hypothetical protein
MVDFFKFRTVVLLSFACLCVSLRGEGDGILADEAVPVDPASLTYREATLNQDPMDLEGVPSRVASILRNYYRVSLGGEDGWSAVESFRFDGILRMQGGALSFVAFKKKPDYCKVVVLGGKGVRVVMSYDGVDAWQLNTGESSEASDMPPLEALNFIRDATAGGHLLYPTLPGKRIELLPGLQTVDGRECYHLQVTLADGQQVIYAIDRLEFIERQMVVVNAVSGGTEVTTHKRIEPVEGVLVPMESTMTIDGEFVHSVEMRAVHVNTGLMPWMFARPSGSYAPGVAAEVEVGPTSAPNLERAAATQSVVEPLRFPSAPASAFESSRFPDLDDATKRSILEDLDDLSQGSL